MALELIAEFGQSVILREVIPGEYDPEMGQTAPDQTREQVAHGIMADFSGLEFQNNSLIKQGDKKLKLAASVGEGVPFIHRSVGVDDSASEVLVKVVDNTVATLLRYRNDASTAAIGRAVDAIAGACGRRARLEFYGVGKSGIVAQDAQHKFFRLGFHTAALSDGHLQIMGASLLGEGDCLVLLSNSGRARDLIDACGIARRNGATTVAITASGSPLARAADIHVAADHREDHERFSPMVSRLLHLMIVDVLATCVALRIGSQALQPTLRRMKNNLLKKRYA